MLRPCVSTILRRRPSKLLAILIAVTAESGAECGRTGADRSPIYTSRLPTARGASRARGIYVAAGGRDVVMSVITFLLDYLELYVLVIQSVIQNERTVLVRQSKAMLVEKRCDLPRPQPVSQP